MIDETMTLTPALMDLMEHEKVIEQGLGTFVDVGNALLSIRDGKKYKAANYSTFEDYCQKRWDIDRSRGYQLMDAAKTAALLSTAVDIPEPRSERQIRPLATLRDEPEKAEAAWALAVEAAEGGQPTSAQVADAVTWVTEVTHAAEPAIKKPDVGGGVSHPARYTNSLLPAFAKLLEPGWRILDPFAGTGKIHGLRDLIDVETVGVEIESEWAALHDDTREASALDLPFADATFDAIVTSPTYGNRLADHHNASDPELRRSYTHDLGRDLHEDNSGDLHWGPEYREFHERAWVEATRVANWRFVLNIKDHIRGGELQLVSMWHQSCLIELGWKYNAGLSIAHGTPSLRSGENAALRVPWEYVLVFDK